MEHKPTVLAIGERVTVAPAGIVITLSVSVQNPLIGLTNWYFTPCAPVGHAEDRRDMIPGTREDRSPVGSRAVP